MTNIKHDARRYIAAIRNAGKRDYAVAYAEWLDSDRNTPEPERPTDLSYMAGQAVRLNLYEYDS
jgi:hypothetical protein